MGSKIKLTDTSGSRFSKKPKINESDLTVSNNELAINETPVGGAGTPGGSNQQVQFNDNGVFGGNSYFVFDKNRSNFFVSCKNYIGGGSYYSSAVGGYCNLIGGESNHSSINGGQNNRIRSYANWSSRRR